MTLSVADSAEVVVGVNVTEIVQFVLAASDAPHLLVCAKSEALVPAMAIELIVKTVVLLFVSVTVCAALFVFKSTFPKLIEAGARVTVPVGAVPVPLSWSVWGLLGSLSVTCRVAVSFPVVVGAKVTVIVQVVPEGSVPGEAGQWFVCVKSVVPMIEIDEIVSAELELFSSVTVC